MKARLVFHEKRLVWSSSLDSAGIVELKVWEIPRSEQYPAGRKFSLFLVVQGEGWVHGEESDRTRIRAYQAAYWEKGEWHESGTETGMTAIIIEGENSISRNYHPWFDDR